MRIALCFFGIVGGTKGKNGFGEPVDFRYCAETVFKNIVYPNDKVDIFLHSWSEEYKEDLIEIYKPKDFKIEKRTVFPTEALEQQYSAKNFTSRMLSTYYSMQLKAEYEKKHDFKYDCVMVTRYDIVYLTEFLLKEYDMDYFWASNWIALNPNEYAAAVKTPPPKTNRSLHHRGFHDIWYFSNSEIMDYYGDLYLHASKKLMSQNIHKLIYHYMSKKYPNNIKFTKHNIHDYDLYRYRLSAGLQYVGK